MFDFAKAIKQLDEAGDVLVFPDKDGSIGVTILDCDGWDDDWEEIEHDFAMPDLVDAVENFINEHATGDFYKDLHVGSTIYHIGYSSMDI